MAGGFLISLLLTFFIVINASARTGRDSVAKINCTHDGFLPHPTNCRAFYWCSMRRNFRAIMLECDDRQIFDTQAQTCTYPWLSTRKECGGTLHLSYDVEAEFVAPQIPDRKLKAVCSRRGYFPDENDCAKYYRCVDNGRGQLKRYDFTCKHGTVWDPSIDSCNYPWAARNVHCNERVGTSGVFDRLLSSYRVPSLQSNVFTRRMPYSVSNLAKPELNNDNNILETDTGNECCQEGFIHDPLDCNKFYRCIETGPRVFVKLEFTCGLGKIWDTETGTCVHPWAAGREDCRTERIPEDAGQNDIPTEELNPEKDKEQDPLSPAKRDPSYSRQIEQSEPECIEEGFMLDPNNCRHFYRCVQNGRFGFTKYEFSCGEGTVWDSETLSCNHPANTRGICGTSKQPNPDNTHPEYVSSPQPSSTESQEISDKPSSNTLPVQSTPNYSNKTTEASVSTPTANIETTTKPLMEIDEPLTTTVANNEQSSIEPSTDVLLDVCTQEGFIGDSKDCKIFYQCIRQGKNRFIKQKFTCETGTIWDLEEATCKDPFASKRHCDPLSGVPDDHDKNNDNNKHPDNIPDPDEICNNEGPTSLPGSSETIQPEVSVTQASSTSQSHTEPISSSTPKQNIELSTEKQDNNCKHEGFMGDSEDCQIFYRCVNHGGARGFTKYTYTCGEGTVWDSELNTCNHPSAVRDIKCGSGTLTEQTIETEKETNIKQTEQPETTASELSTTKHPTTTSRTSQPELSSESTTVRSTEQTPLSTTVAQIETVTSSTPKQDIEITETQDNNCKQEGFMGDSEDCQTFHRCVYNDIKRGFTKYSFSCGEGTVWDAELNTCNHPSAVRDIKCGSGTITEQTQEPTIETEKETTIRQTEQPETTASALSTTKQHTTTTRTSQPELSSESTTVRSTEQTPLSSTVAQTETVTSSTPKQDVEISTEKQDNNCKQEGFMGDSEDCQIFHRCIYNDNKRGFTKFSYTCGEGTVWDSELNTCNHPSAVRDIKCGSGTIIEQTQEPTIETEKETTIRQTEQPETTASALSTTKQHTTTTRTSQPELSSESTTVLSTEQTPLSSTVAQTETVTSSTPKQDVEISTEKQDNNCKQEGFMGDSEDCQTFHRCVYNDIKRRFTKYSFSCGEGTVWDAELNTCNHPSAVRDIKCASGTITEQTQEPTIETEKETMTTQTEQPETTTFKSSTTKQHTTSTRKSQSELSSQFTTIISTEQTPLSTTVAQTETVTSSTPKQHIEISTEKQDNNCKQQGFMGDSEDCQIFYRCVNHEGARGFTKYTYTCGEGTVWDSDLNTCNHPSAVRDIKCGSGTITEQTQESTTETEQEITTTQTEPETTASETTTDTPSFTSQSQTETESTTTEQPFTTTEIGESFTTDFITTTNQPEISTTLTHSTSEPSSEQPSTTSETSKPESSTVLSTETILPEISSTSQLTTVQTTPPPKGIPPKTSCKRAGFFPNVEDCNKFYRCVPHGAGFIKYDFSCGPGTIWDPDLDTCNYPYAVRNKKCGAATETPQTSSTSTERIPEITQTEAPQITPGSDNQYACTDEGFYPSKQDCNKFYRCVKNGYGSYSVYPFRCPDGTIFDTNIKTCNHHYAAENRACGHKVEMKPTTVKDITTTTVQSPTEVDREITTTPSQETTTEFEQQTTTISEQGTTEVEIPTTQSPETTTEVEQQTTTISEQTTTEVEIPTTQSPETTTEVEQQTTTISEQTTTEVEIPTTQSPETTTAVEQQTTTISEQSTTENEMSSTMPSQETTTEKIETISTTLSPETTTIEVEKEITPTPPQETTTEVEQPTTTISEQSTTEIILTTPSQETTTEEVATESISTTQSPETTTVEQQTTTISEQSTTELVTDISSTMPSEETTTEVTTLLPTTQTDTTPSYETTLLPITTEGKEQTTVEESSVIPTSSSAPPTVGICPIAQIEGHQIALVCPTGFKRHPKYCNFFYQCTSDPLTAEINVLVFSCPNGTIYDDEKIQCVAPEKSTEKCAGEIKTKEQILTRNSNSVFPIEIGNQKQFCPSKGKFALDSVKCMNKFIKCEDSPTGKSMQAYVQKCKEGFTFWPISRKCEKLSLALSVGCVEKRGSFVEQHEFMIPVEVEKIDIRRSAFKKVIKK